MAINTSDNHISGWLGTHIIVIVRPFTSLRYLGLDIFC